MGENYRKRKRNNGKECVRKRMGNREKEEEIKK